MWPESAARIVAIERLCCILNKFRRCQSFGEFVRFHPHWHVLVLDGGFTKYDRFVYLPIGADEGILKVWKSTILSLFLRKNLIDQARADMMGDWKHSGFSLAPEGWQKGHPNKSHIAQATPPESEETVQAPDAWSKLRRESRAKLLRKIYEIDPYV